MAGIEYPIDLYFYEFGFQYARDINCFARAAGEDPHELCRMFQSISEDERYDFVEALLSRIKFDPIDPQNTVHRYSQCLFLFHKLMSLEGNGISEELKSTVYDILWMKRSYYNHGCPLTDREVGQLLRKNKVRSATSLVKSLVFHKLKTESVGQNIALDIICPETFESLQMEVFGEVTYRALRKKSIDGKVLYFQGVSSAKEYKYILKSLETLVSRVKRHSQNQ